MPILTCTNISHNYGDRPILQGISLSIEPNDRIGIVGRNGAGKTTLMKVLTGQLKPDIGQVVLQRGARVGYLHQDHNLDPTETLREAAEGAFEALHKLHKDLDHLYEEMATAQGDELDRLLKRQMELEAAMEAAGGYTIEHKIEEVLHGLGFTDAQFDIKVANLSGGQKGRLALARLLLESPDIMLLDEPTNHLDIDGRLWLEDYLTQDFKGAVVMVSHDRYLLDAVVTRIIETEQCRLIDYPGNYMAFRQLRAERRTVMHRAYEAQQSKIKKEEEYIRRFKAGQRARQAAGREKRLDREKRDNLLERPMEMAELRLSLPKGERTGDIVVSARGIAKKYINEEGHEKVLFKDLDISIGRGERWGIIGPNGAGKSTLIRCLLGETPVDQGILRLGSNVKVGHYRQTHEHVPSDVRVYRYLQDVILKEAPQAAMSEQAARNLAGAFLFSGEDQEKEMGMLSGGERSRAVIAGLLASAKNLLILDEPTNHLDISSAERLEDALRVDEENDGYEGTLILISHDRALIDATCDHLLVLDGKGNTEVFTGGYTDWHEKELDKKKRLARQEAEEKEKREAADRQRKAQAEAKAKQSQPPKAGAKPSGGSGGSGPSANSLARLKTEQLEQKIEKIQIRLKDIDGQLGNPDVWRDAKKSSSLSEERGKLVGELEPLEFEWARRAEES